MTLCDFIPALTSRLTSPVRRYPGTTRTAAMVLRNTIVAIVLLRLATRPICVQSACKTSFVAQGGAGVVLVTRRTDYRVRSYRTTSTGSPESLTAKRRDCIVCMRLALSYKEHSTAHRQWNITWCMARRLPPAVDVRRRGARMGYVCTSENDSPGSPQC